ncbi:MAG: hypothetical protein V7K49_29475 [Nostoc sp.]
MAQPLVGHRLTPLDASPLKSPDLPTRLAPLLEAQDRIGCP